MTGAPVASAPVTSAQVMTGIAQPAPEVTWYRAKAAKARARAAVASNEGLRKVLLNDAKLWNRMALYAGQTPAPSEVAEFIFRCALSLPENEGKR